MKKYKVTTSCLIGAGDMSHDDKWIFNTREEAQKFVDKFHEVFPRSEINSHDPYIYSSVWKPEIEEIDENHADPYTWLERQIKEKEERLGRK